MNETDPLLDLEAPDGHPTGPIHDTDFGFDAEQLHNAPDLAHQLIPPQGEHAAHPGAYGGDTAPNAAPHSGGQQRANLHTPAMFDGDDRPVEPQPIPTNPGILAEMIASEIEQLTRELVRNTAVSGISDVLLASTDQPHASVEQPDQPVLGTTRTILTDRRGGGTYVAAAATPVLIASPNNGRTGIQISNSGAGGATLYLATIAEVNAGVGGLPSIWLPVGVTWNGLLSKVLWVGSITAVAAAGGTILNVATT